MWFLSAGESTTGAGVDGDEDAADCLIRCLGGADSSSADGERGRTVPLCNRAQKDNNGHTKSGLYNTIGDH